MQFNSLKETIRHFSLLPAGGGGILAHAVARVASSIKVNAKEIISLTSLISDYAIASSISMFLIAVIAVPGSFDQESSNDMLILKSIGYLISTYRTGTVLCHCHHFWWP